MTQEQITNEDSQERGIRWVIEQQSAHTLESEARRIQGFKASVERAKLYFSIRELQQRFGAAAVRSMVDELQTVPIADE